MYMVGGLVRLRPFVAVKQRCDAPASNGLQKSGSWRLPGAARSSDVGAAQPLLHRASAPTACMKATACASPTTSQRCCKI